METQTKQVMAGFGCYGVDVTRPLDFCKGDYDSLSTKVQCYQHCNPNQSLTSLTQICQEQGSFIVQCYRPRCAMYTRTDRDATAWQSSQAAWVAEFCDPYDSEEYARKLQNMAYLDTIKVCCDLKSTNPQKLAPAIAVPIIVVIAVAIIAGGVIWACQKKGICKVRPRGGR